MKKHLRFWIGIALVLLTVALVAFAATPGSDQDPLVTLSYVEKR